MPQVSTVYPPEMWANESLLTLVDMLVMAGLVHTDFKNELRGPGDTVNTRKPTKGFVRTWAGMAATDANEQIVVDRLKAKNLAIVLDTMIYTAFLVEDRDATVSIKDLREEFMIPYMDPMAQKVDDDIMTEFTSASSSDVDGNAVTAVAFGTVGLGAALDPDDVISASLALNLSQAPLRDRRLVLSATHEADLQRQALFQQAQQAGNTQTLREGSIGRAFGFDTYMSQNVPDAVDTDTTPQSLAFHPNALAFINRPLAVPAGVRAAVGINQNIAMRVITAYDPRYFGEITTFSMLYAVQLMDANLAKIINP